jgi:hypothetical protein
MARLRADRAGPLTPEQAYRTNRAIRSALSIAAIHAWLIVGVIALIAPRLLVPGVVLAVLYTASMPFVLRSVERDTAHRTLDDDNAAQESFGRRRC